MKSAIDAADSQSGETKACPGIKHHYTGDDGNMKSICFTAMPLEDKVCPNLTTGEKASGAVSCLVEHLQKEKKSFLCDARLRKGGL